MQRDGRIITLNLHVMHTRLSLTQTLPPHDYYALSEVLCGDRIDLPKYQMLYQFPVVIIEEKVSSAV